MTGSEYFIEGNHFVIKRPQNTRKQVSFDWPIAQVVVSDGFFVVRLEPAPGACDNQNVFGVNADAMVVWQVPAHKHVYDDSPYTGLVPHGDCVALVNWDGLELWVKASSGEITNKTYGK